MVSSFSTWRVSLLALFFSLYVSFVCARWTFNPSSYSELSVIPSFSSKTGPSSNVDIEDLSDPDYVLQIKSIKITPDIIVPGGDVTIQATGTLLATVSEGTYADVVVRLGRVSLLKKRFDLCELLSEHKEEVDLQCPIEQGDLTITQKITLPKEVPRAKFTVSVVAFTQDDEPLAALRITANFMMRPPKHGLVGIFAKQEEEEEYYSEY